MAHLDRPLAAPTRDTSSRRSVARKAALVLVVIGLVVFVVSRLDFSRGYTSLKNTGFASGSHDGNYAAVVDELDTLARMRGGTLHNVETAGSMENVTRLVNAASHGCDVAFALAQDGSDWDPPSAAGRDKTGASGKLEVLARLPKLESVFILGRDADALTQLTQLSGKKIGVGPAGSGSERLAQQLFALPEMKGLGVSLVNGLSTEQLEAAKRGQLDLAILIIDEDAPLVVSAIRDGGLQIANLAHLDVLARRLPHVRSGRIGAGQYEPLKVLPAEDKRVLRVETVVIANRCASRSATIDLLAVLSHRFPELMRHNKETPNTTGLEMSATAQGFFDHGGPEMADEYAPWLVDVMPPANWAYIVMGVSLLFNAMSAGHRFRLWRIDDARVKLEAELAPLFGAHVTLGDIDRTEPRGPLASTESKTVVTNLIERLEQLAARSRRQSLSMLVPMGQEMAYRYQEEIIYETLSVLRAFLAKSSAPAA